MYRLSLYGSRVPIGTALEKDWRIIPLRYSQFDREMRIYQVKIGRELYSAPDIFIDLLESEYMEREGKVYPKGNLFSVQEMNVDQETQKITSLVIVDRSLNVRFQYPKTVKKQPVKKNDERRAHPTESQLMSMARRIAKGENLTDKIQTNFLMSQKEWLHLDELIKQQTQNI